MTRENHDTLFPDFGDLSFTNIKAVSEASEEISLQEHGIIVEADPLYPSGKNLTSCEMVGSDVTACKWLGYKGVFEN
jgi:hypothetical protein